MKKQFNLVIVGVGGQGVLTLLETIAQASLMEGHDIKTSELHGLSQRGGSVEVHARFGKKIFSPLVRQGNADLIISLEAQEALRACSFASKESIFLVNDFLVSIPGQVSPKIKEISKILKKFSKKIILIPASDICQKEIGKAVTAGIFLLSYASFKNLIPLKSDSLLKAIKKVIPKKYLDLNIRTFRLAQEP
ncbi:2-oxoacid:acceptor oxidoreductase family protein [Patescibacteria group bacterium]|nr:2-oxoacid:acceptor oxidoreductase family protein [Patescibacteria group bacterium]